jgi:thioredoxin-related protein
MRALLAAVLVCAAGAALAAEPWERFFELSFGDLRAEAADAKKAGKIGLLVMYEFEECPYCAAMKRDVLSRPDVQAAFGARFRAIQIDTRGSQPVTGFDGRTLAERDFARAAGIRGTPTFVFYGLDGAMLAVQRGAISDPAVFILLGDYVATGAYRHGSFAAWLQARRQRGG